MNDLRDAARKIRSGPYSPMYVFYGQESFLMGEMLALLESKLVAAEDKDFLLSKYDLNETPIEQVVEDAETIPFFGGPKLVVATNAVFLTAAKDSSKTEHRMEALEAYVKAPADHSVLVLCTSHPKLDERKGLVKSIKKVAEVLAFEPLQGQALIQWVQQQSKKSGMRWETGAMELFIETAGTSLQRLSQELAKIITYLGHDQTIAQEVIRQLISRTLEDNVLLLMDHVSRVRLDEAFRLLYDLFQQKEEPIKLLIMIAKHFSMMLQVKQLSERGYGQQQMASVLGIHPYRIKLAGEQANRYQAALLKRIVVQLSDIDYRVKTGQVDKVLALELFLLQLGDWVKEH